MLGVFQVMTISITGEPSTSAAVFLWGSIGYVLLKKYCLAETITRPKTSNNRESLAKTTQSSLSWADEQHNPTGSFDVYGNDLKLEHSDTVATTREIPTQSVANSENSKRKRKNPQTVITLSLLGCACVFLLVLSFSKSPANNEDYIVPDSSIEAENVGDALSDKDENGTLISVNVRMTTFDDEFTAEYVLAKFESGIGTETQIKDLMKEYGSVNNDGTLQAIEPGWLVEELDTWCFDPTRQAGDIVIIENDYGFTLCYISSVNRQ